MTRPGTTRKRAVQPPSRTVLITGAAKGLGRAMARHLAGPETHLLLHYHQSRAAGKELVQELEGQGAQVTLLQADLTDPAARERMMKQVARKTRALQVMINNVGLYDGRSLMEFEPEDWHNTLESGPGAVFHLIKRAVPLLTMAAPARVINLGDSGCDRLSARPQATPYHVAKNGVYTLTRSFARELAPLGITVNMLSPGFFENSVGEPGTPIPAGRKGTPMDLLPALDYLLSSEAQYMTGCNLVLNGGWNL